MRHLIPTVAVAVAVAASAAVHAEETCLASGKAATLTGVMRQVEVFGAPGYGRKLKRDSVQTIDVLVLDQPACIVGRTESARGVQVMSGDALLPTVRGLVGRHISVEGELAEGSSGRSYTTLVVQATTAKEAKGGTFSRVQGASVLDFGRAPVRVGTHGPTAYGCTGVGHLVTAASGAVRELGNPQSPVLGYAKPGDTLHLCETSAEGDWFGVIVSPAGSRKDCGATEPSKTMTPYRGRCLSGWLSADEVTIEAS